MTDIPADAKQAIDAVIENDEGGWKLTSNPNDMDGGWTYAGVTAKVMCEHQNTKGVYFKKDIVPFEDLKKFIEANSGGLENVVYNIYYAKYYKPLIDRESHAGDPVLSCAIDCGVDTAINILDAACDHEEQFCHHWLLHYAELVKKNAEAWRDYALASEACLNEVIRSGTVSVPKIDKPKTLRAEFLAGWINRVERYR